MSLITSLIPSLAGAPTQTEEGSASASRNATGTDLGPTVSPRYQVTETAEAFGLVVELPGVAKDGLELSVDHAQIRVVGRRAWQQPEKWTAHHREIRDAAFVLNLEHGRAIDAEKVQAELRDGILRVALPKAEALKPRKITVA